MYGTSTEIHSASVHNTPRQHPVHETHLFCMGVLLYMKLIHEIHTVLFLVLPIILGKGHCNANTSHL